MQENLKKVAMKMSASLVIILVLVSCIAQLGCAAKVVVDGFTEWRNPVAQIGDSISWEKINSRMRICPLFGLQDFLFLMDFSVFFWCISFQSQGSLEAVYFQRRGGFRWMRLSSSISPYQAKLCVLHGKNFSDLFSHFATFFLQKKSRISS